MRTFSKAKVKIAVIASVLVLPALAFNSCQKMAAVGGSHGNGNGSSSLSSSSASKEEETLMEVLNKSVSRAASLNSLQSQLDAKEKAETDSLKRLKWAELGNEAKITAEKLIDIKDKILNLLQVRRLPISHGDVLNQVDFLILALSDARSIELEIMLRAEIGRVESEAKDRDDALKAEIDKLTTEFAAFKADVEKFRDQVNSRFAGLESEVAAVKARLGMLDKLVQEYKASSDAADAALKVALNDLKNFTEKQVVELTEQNAKLKEDILKQKAVLEELFKSQAGVATLAGRLCKTAADGSINDTRTKCTGSEPDLYNGAMCCITIESVDCSVLFPSEVQVTAQNQCNILVATVKNHDEQLKAIREVDAKQTELISGLLDDVASLTKQVEILGEGFKLLNNAVLAISAKLSNIDQRLLIVEFKASRAEAAAALMERADLNLAWIARRTTDVSSRYCSALVRQSLDQFDYEAARQNWHYCKERLEFLTRAKELTQLAKAYTNGLQSINVDTSCSANIADKPAENLTNAELMQEAIFNQVMAKCTTGGQVVARAMLLNVVQLLGVVGPDFRTAAYMAKKAKIAQILFFGRPVSETTSQERAEFEMVDPTDARLAKTLYGRIERPFIKRYVENRMRTLAGGFPEQPSAIPENIPGFDTVYTLGQMKSGSTPYLQRLAALEAEGLCSECGFAVTGRANTDVVISRDGKERFSYPKDIESLCPVMNDVVVMKNSNGKYYPYYLNYNGMQEELKPVLSSGSHVAIANSDADVASGNFTYCGRQADYTINRNGPGVALLRSRAMVTATQPYGTTYAGRGACVHTAIKCVMRDKEWIAPSGSTDLLSYLSGFANSVVDNKCKFNIGSKSVVRVRNLESYEQARIRTFSGTVDASSIALQSKLITANTQLTKDYWTLKDAVLNYGAGNQPVSKTSPFFGLAASHGDRFVRAHYAVTGPVPVQECTPNE